MVVFSGRNEYSITHLLGISALQCNLRTKLRLSLYLMLSKYTFLSSKKFCLLILCLFILLINSYGQDEANPVLIKDLNDIEIQSKPVIKKRVWDVFNLISKRTRFSKSIDSAEHIGCFVPVFAQTEINIATISFSLLKKELEQLNLTVHIALRFEDSCDSIITIEPMHRNYTETMETLFFNQKIELSKPIIGFFCFVQIHKTSTVDSFYLISFNKHFKKKFTYTFDSNNQIVLYNPIDKVLLTEDPYSENLVKNSERFNWAVKVKYLAR